MNPRLFTAGIFLCLVILCSGSILQTWAGGPNGWGADDAFISYRYARNLATGRGLVFNPGERVEGYTNFLYVLLMTPAFWVTNNDGAFFFSVLLNLLLTVAALLLFVAHLRQRLGESYALGGALLFALCLPIWVGVAWGLETALVLAVSLAVWVAVEQVASEPAPRRVFLLCLALVLALLARADGFIIVGVALFYLALKRRFHALATSTAVVTVAMAVYELWRYAYYGNLLPNTFYAKVAGPLGFRFAHAYQQLSKIFTLEGLLPPLVVILFTVGEESRKILRGESSLAKSARFDLIFPFVWLAYWFYIGGDLYEDRFLLILYALGIFTLLRFLAGNVRGNTLAYVVVVLAMMEVVPHLSSDYRCQYNFHRYDGWILTGKFLGTNLPGKVLATGALGKICFFSDLKTQDMLGLTDPVLAHRPVAALGFSPGHMKFDPDYTLSRKPDLIADGARPTLDLFYDLTREKYEKAGYQIRYLIDTKGNPSGQHILDVKGLDYAAMQQLVAQGYDFAVLARK